MAQHQIKIKQINITNVWVAEGKSWQRWINKGRSEIEITLFILTAPTNNDEAGGPTQSPTSRNQNCPPARSSFPSSYSPECPFLYFSWLKAVINSTSKLYYVVGAFSHQIVIGRIFISNFYPKIKPFLILPALRWPFNFSVEILSILFSAM